MSKVFFAILILLLISSFSAANVMDDTEPFPVELNVGELFYVCLSGQVVCPARTPICDDIKMVDVVDTPKGMAFKGIAPGTTLCSVAHGTGRFRRVFRINIR